MDALLRVLPRVRGAFSLVILDERRVIGVRDPHGFRPLVLGRLPLPGRHEARACGATTTGGWILASETAALDIVGAEFVRDVEPGEIVVLEAGREPVSVRYAAATPALCVFELIYFARPDSYMEGGNLYEARRQMGMQLAGEHPAEADLVMPVPDTGAPAAAGFAEASGHPVPRRPRPQPVQRPHVHPAVARRCASGASTSSSARCARSSATSG